MIIHNICDRVSTHKIMKMSKYFAKISEKFEENYNSLPYQLTFSQIIYVIPGHHNFLINITISKKGFTKKKMEVNNKIYDAKLLQVSCHKH